MAYAAANRAVSARPAPILLLAVTTGGPSARALGVRAAADHRALPSGVGVSNVWRRSPMCPLGALGRRRLVDIASSCGLVYVESIRTGCPYGDRSRRGTPDLPGEA